MLLRKENRMNRNPVTSSIIEYMSHPVASVRSCSECSMERIGGKINITGILHRSSCVDAFGHLDCCKCPVHQKSVETGEFQRILMALDGEK